MVKLAVGFKAERGPEWTAPCGGALWIVQFFVTTVRGVAVKPDPRGAGGWVVQKIESTYDVVDCVTGLPLNPKPNPYIFYEAFPVGADGTVPVTATSMVNWDTWNFVSRPRTAAR